MGNLKDMTGHRFGMWTVIEFARVTPTKNYMWLCQCDCGIIKEVNGHTLRAGKSTNCGCQRIFARHDYNKTHGGKKDRLYHVLNGMKHRCYNKNDPAYDHYGGRGIKVCDDWRNDYAAFRDWAMQNGYQPDAKKYECTIDRIDNNGDYSPENCRWVNQKAQCRNTRANHFIEYNGEKRTIVEWAEIYNIRKDTLRRRIFVYGWDVERALHEPVRPRTRHQTDT